MRDCANAFDLRRQHPARAPTTRTAVCSGCLASAFYFLEAREPRYPAAVFPTGQTDKAPHPPF